jgi:hypothetical protein
MVLSFIDYRLQLTLRRVLVKSSVVVLLLSGSSHISAVALPLNQEDGSQDLDNKL